MLLPNHPRATTIWSSTTSVYILRRPADKKQEEPASNQPFWTQIVQRKTKKLWPKTNFGKNKNYHQKQNFGKINKKNARSVQNDWPPTPSLQLLPPKRALHRMRTTQRLRNAVRNQKPHTENLLRKQCCCPITRGLRYYNLIPTNADHDMLNINKSSSEIDDADS